MKELNRKLVNRMVDKTSSNGGGGNSYVPQSQAVSWTDIDGKPTTLAGYGITDAYWATTQSTSDKRNLTIGSVTQQVITAHQSLSGYATEYWVGQQGYLTSVSWGDVSDKPGTYPPSEHSHSWSSITNKPTSKTAWGKTYLNASSEFQNISGDLSAGNSGGTISQFHSIELNSAGSLSGYGGFIDFHFNGSSADYTSRIIEDASGKLNINQAVFVNYNGNVGIGDKNPAYKLEVGGNCRISSSLSIATTSTSYALNVGGTIYATGGFTFLSDIRKKDVETYQWSPTLDMIADAPIIRYTMKGDETHRMRVGSVAQYWQKVMPETVTETNDTLSMDGTTIALTSVIALARVVKQLKVQIDRLMQQIYG